MTEPVFADGAFHIEYVGDAWGVYDAFDNRMWLYFATDAEAIDATRQLARAADSGTDVLERAYLRLLPRARASMANVA